MDVMGKMCVYGSTYIMYVSLGLPSLYYNFFLRDMKINLCFVDCILCTTFERKFATFLLYHIFYVIVKSWMSVGFRLFYILNGVTKMMKVLSVFFLFLFEESEVQIFMLCLRIFSLCFSSKNTNKETIDE